MKKYVSYVVAILTLAMLVATSGCTSNTSKINNRTQEGNANQTSALVGTAWQGTFEITDKTVDEVSVALYDAKGEFSFNMVEVSANNDLGGRYIEPQGSGTAKGSRSHSSLTSDDRSDANFEFTFRVTGAAPLSGVILNKWEGYLTFDKFSPLEVAGTRTYVWDGSTKIMPWMTGVDPGFDTVYVEFKDGETFTVDRPLDRLGGTRHFTVTIRKIR